MGRTLVASNGVRRTQVMGMEIHPPRLFLMGAMISVITATITPVLNSVVAPNGKSVGWTSLEILRIVFPPAWVDSDR